ncbi:hypothetical protein [Paractinoplanes durhamensis]|uniref:hypothetical protein n=1 Tax=Paractinoplanes durhamensis TaxID=113563 RepID=UPI0019455F19|nr:hypothetical protein [Actinoplanes durhamensis]
MTAVARVLPRHWDGRRLLRFLTGLAMLALAFTTPAPAAPATPIPVTSVAQSAETPASVPPGESATAVSEVRVVAAPRPAEILAITGLGLLVVLIGAAPRIRGERAPPAI